MNSGEIKNDLCGQGRAQLFPIDHSSDDCYSHTEKKHTKMEEEINKHNSIVSRACVTLTIIIILNIIFQKIQPLWILINFGEILFIRYIQ